MLAASSLQLTSLDRGVLLNLLEFWLRAMDSGASSVSEELRSTEAVCKFGSSNKDTFVAVSNNSNVRVSHPWHAGFGAIVDASCCHLEKHN